MKHRFTCRQRGSRRERYTSAELVSMHLACGVADCNRRAVQWLPNVTPGRQTPCHTFFTCLHQSLSDNGSFIVDAQERDRRVRTPNNEETVLDLIQSNLGTSMRIIASHVGISHRTV
ncbi:DUF4817 domain-containing protein [Trichonephila clavipes]|nr:DUF4817 domain-containing protein [Trichonephila clavipes]